MNLQILKQTGIPGIITKFIIYKCYSKFINKQLNINALKQNINLDT